MTMRTRLGRVTSNPWFLLGVFLFFITAATCLLLAQGISQPNRPGTAGFDRGGTNTQTRQRLEFPLEPQRLDLEALGSELIGMVRLPLAGPQNFWGYYDALYGSEPGGWFYHPMCVKRLPDGKLLVLDSSNNQIQLFDSDFSFLLKWGSYGSGEGEFINPMDAAISSDGSIYIMDQHNQRVQVFSEDGTYLRQWGEYGSLPGQFLYPGGIAVTDDGKVFIADTSNNRIQVFDTNGTYISQWGEVGSSNGQFWVPYGIDLSPNGLLYVTDTYNHRIQIFTTNGDFLSTFGSFGSGKGEFYFPYGVAFSQDGRVFVGDSYNARVEIFDTNNNYLAEWGSWEDGMTFVEYVDVAPDGSMLYLPDFDNNRIRPDNENIS